MVQFRADKLVGTAHAQCLTSSGGRMVLFGVDGTAGTAHVSYHKCSAGRMVRPPEPPRHGAQAVPTAPNHPSTHTRKGWSKAVSIALSKTVCLPKLVRHGV